MFLSMSYNNCKQNLFYKPNDHKDIQYGDTPNRYSIYQHSHANPCLSNYDDQSIEYSSMGFCNVYIYSQSSLNTKYFSNIV